MEEWKQTQVNENIKHVEMSNKSGSHIGCVRISTANTLEHEIAKLIVCYEILKEGKTFITEAKLKRGGRPDIVNLVEGIAIEILHTEKEKQNLKDYPYDIEEHRAEEIIDEWIENYNTKKSPYYIKVGTKKPDVGDHIKIDWDKINKEEE